MTTAPGLLFVTFQPEPGFSLAQYHDWYNNEHGPARLRISYFNNGFRYRMRGDAKPDWMVIYHVSDVTGLHRHPYTTLREAGVKTDRETEVMRHVEIKRGIFNHVYTKQARDIPEQESGAVVVGERIEVPAEHAAAFNKWYEEEHIPLMSRVAGWMRSRRYSTYSADGGHPAEHLALHEYDQGNGLSGREAQSAVEASWLHGMTTYGAKKSAQMVWDKIYDFGPASRDLGSLHDPSAYFFQSRDGKTISWPIPGQEPSTSSPAYQESRFGEDWSYGTPTWPAIRSFVTAQDGVDLTYQIEGGGNPDAPLIVLVNPLLATYRVWDAFVASFLSLPTNKHFRVLRYDARGSSQETTTGSVALDLLVSDLITLLDALRVRKAAAVVGAGLGAATALGASKQHSDRVNSVIATNLDFQAKENYPQTWLDRIKPSEAGSSEDTSDNFLTGQQLAQDLLQHWYPKADPANDRLNKEISKVSKIVSNNPKKSFVQFYQMLDNLTIPQPYESLKAKVLLVAGSADEAQLQKSADMARLHGKDAKVETITGGGKLPMIEDPEALANIVGTFVRSL